jgi:transposase
LYDREFKVEAAKMVLEKGQGVRETSRKLGISRTTLAGWMRESREYEEDEAFPGRGHRHNTDEEIAKLNRRIRDLEEENAILKKVTHIFSRDTKKNSE